MGSLLTSLLNSSQALGVYQQALQVVQNDVSNANTPGYVKQTPTFEPLPFDVSVGLPGGVTSGPVQSSRNAYAEQNVQQQQSSLGYYQQKASDLGQIQPLFDISGKTGIGPALDGLFSSFSQLSVNPNDPTARQAVLTSAGTLTTTIQQTASGLASASQQVASEGQSTVSAVNRIASTLAQINSEHPRDYNGNVDAGLDAQINSNLEQLSQYTNFTALQQPDGSINVYVGGQTPLVLGSQANTLQGDFSGTPARILDNQGNDISGQITTGQLSSILETQNKEIPSYQTDLNTLAQGVADQVNSALSNGIDANGAAPTNNLFTYDATAGAAQTLAVNPALTTDQIAAASAGSPGGNGNALALSLLGAAKNLSGGTFAQFYGTLGSRVGQDIASAQNGQTTQTNLVTQAQTLRSQTSGVSLDEEAERLIQYQRGYQASAKLISVLNDLTNTAINIIQ